MRENGPIRSKRKEGEKEGRRREEEERKQK